MQNWENQQCNRRERKRKNSNKLIHIHIATFPSIGYSVYISALYCVSFLNNKNIVFIAATLFCCGHNRNLMVFFYIFHAKSRYDEFDDFDLKMNEYWMNYYWITMNLMILILKWMNIEWMNIERGHEHSNNTWSMAVHKNPMQGIFVNLNLYPYLRKIPSITIFEYLQEISLHLKFWMYSR